MSAPSTGPSLGIGCAAKSLSVPITTLRYWIDQGKIPGITLTTGGHRRIDRGSFLQFARSRGVERLAENRRRHPRLPAKKLRVRITLHKDGVLLSQGEGRLRDISRSGFRADQVRWPDKVSPAWGAKVSFEIPAGRLAGVSGTATIAWNMDNRRERGATLGAAVARFHTKKAKLNWLTFTSMEKN